MQIMKELQYMINFSFYQHRDLISYIFIYPTIDVPSKDALHTTVLSK